MKHFAVFIKYLESLDKIKSVQEVHRNLLQSGVEKGIILVSGPIEPRTGGIVIMRSQSMEDVKKFFNEDPYLKNNYAEYTFFEFKPGKHQPFLSDWIN